MVHWRTGSGTGPWLYSATKLRGYGTNPACVFCVTDSASVQSGWQPVRISSSTSSQLVNIQLWFVCWLAILATVFVWRPRRWPWRFKWRATPTRFARVLKWATLLVTALLVALVPIACLEYRWLSLTHVVKDGYALTVEAGAVNFTMFDQNARSLPSGSFLLPDGSVVPSIRSPQGSGWHSIPCVAHRPLVGWMLSLPLWFLALIAAAVSFRLWVRVYPRRPHGACQNCGYDLTGNISGRCPECGAACPPGWPTASAVGDANLSDGAPRPDGP